MFTQRRMFWTIASKLGSDFQYGLSTRPLYTGPAWPTDTSTYSAKRFSSSTQRMRSSASSARWLFWKIAQL